MRNRSIITIHTKLNVRWRKEMLTTCVGGSRDAGRSSRQGVDYYTQLCRSKKTEGKLSSIMGLLLASASGLPIPRR